MKQQQLPQMLELPQRVITGTSCLIPLKPLDADADVRCQNHVHVVRAIPNPKSSYIWDGLPDQLNDFSLLFGGNPARDDHLAGLRDEDELRG